jgi:hypothetical protein
MCKGEAHGQFEHRPMLVNSKRLNSALAISRFFWIKEVGFFENWGVAAHVNVVLHSVKRIRQHITCVQN